MRRIASTIEKRKHFPVDIKDRNLLAVVSDAHLDWSVPRYAANDCEGLAEFIVAYFRIDLSAGRDFKRSACG